MRVDSRELLDLLPVAAHRFGLSRRDLDHLVWQIRHTRVMDWEPGNRAVVYKSVAETAAERGVTPRQINNYERAIAAAFGIEIERSYNRRRYGHRDREGRIVSAFGFELTRLRDALPRLRAVKAELDEGLRQRRARKAELSAARGRVRRLADAVFACGDAEQIDAARAIAERIRGRVSDAEDVAALERRILDVLAAETELQALLLAGKCRGERGETSDRSEMDFRPIDPLLDSPSVGKPTGCSPERDTGHRRSSSVDGSARSAPERRRWSDLVPIDDFDGPAYVPPEDIGADRIHVGIVRRAASARFLGHAGAIFTTEDVITAAKGLLPELRIGGATWRYACELIGPYAAALCVLVADRAVSERGIVYPAAYVRAMAKRALTGELALDRSLFGLAFREGGASRGEGSCRSGGHG